MTLVDLRRPSVIWRLEVGYVTAIAAFVILLEFATSFLLIDGCAPYILPWGACAQYWRPLRPYVSGEIFVLFLNALLVSFLPSLAIMLGFVWLRVRTWAVFLLPPCTLAIWFILRSSRDVPQGHFVGWGISASFVVLALVLPPLLFYWIGWLPAWRAADAARSQSV